MSFKTPNSIGFRHDDSWRIQQAVPAKGEIVVFNRSLFAEVLAMHVHKLVPKGTGGNAI